MKNLFISLFLLTLSTGTAFASQFVVSCNDCADHELNNTVAQTFQNNFGFNTPSRIVVVDNVNQKFNSYTPRLVPDPDRFRPPEYVFIKTLTPDDVVSDFERFWSFLDNNTMQISMSLAEFADAVDLYYSNNPVLVHDYLKSHNEMHHYAHMAIQYIGASIGNVPFVEGYFNILANTERTIRLNDGSLVYVKFPEPGKASYLKITKIIGPDGVAIPLTLEQALGRFVIRSGITATMIHNALNYLNVPTYGIDFDFGGGVGGDTTILDITCTYGAQGEILECTRTVN